MITSREFSNCLPHQRRHNFVSAATGIAIAAALVDSPSKPELIITKSAVGYRLIPNG